MFFCHIKKRAAEKNRPVNTNPRKAEEGDRHSKKRKTGADLRRPDGSGRQHDICSGDGGGTDSCFCGKPIEHYHHLMPRHRGGSDLPENLIGVCRSCHEKIHTGKLVPDGIGIRKRYGALSVLNQAVPYIVKGLIGIFGEGHAGTCFGSETADFRDTHHLDKDHDVDAVCIACIGAKADPASDALKPQPHSFQVLQFRRHDRQIVRKQSERTYYLDGKPVCKNRHKRFEQKGISLEEFRQQHPSDVGRLTVKPSRRSYNDTGRLMPGAVFLYKGQRYVLTGTKNKGTRFLYDGCPASGISARQCTVLRQNEGLVYAG